MHQALTNPHETAGSKAVVGERGRKERRGDTAACRNVESVERKPCYGRARGKRVGPSKGDRGRREKGIMMKLRNVLAGWVTGGLFSIEWRGEPT